MTPLHCQSEISGFAIANFYLKNSVTSSSFIVMNDNTDESQIETQISKKVNKHTNIIIIPVTYWSHWFSIASYLKEKIICCFNIPKQVDASSCVVHATLNIWFLLQLGETYNQFDIVNSRIWFANQIFNMSREQVQIKKLDLKHRG